jgi:uncharacterized protein
MILFVLLAFGLSWLAWAPLSLAAWREGQAWPYWHLLGGLGPAVAAVVVTARGGDGRLGELLRWLDPRRTHPGWLALAVLGPVALYGISALVLALMGQGWPHLGNFGASREYPALPRPVYWLANIVFYGYGEEIGWRGFLLPLWQRRYGARVATLLVAVVWALWHLPLFGFAAGMRAMGPAEIGGWFLSLLTGSFLLTWLFNRSGSIAAVALFHGVLDITIGSPGHPMTANIMGAALTLVGIAAVVAHPGQTVREARDDSASPAR